MQDLFTLKCYYFIQIIYVRLLTLKAPRDGREYSLRKPKEKAKLFVDQHTHWQSMKTGILASFPEKNNWNEIYIMCVCVCVLWIYIYHGSHDYGGLEVLTSAVSSQPGDPRNQWYRSIQSPNAWEPGKPMV